MLYLIQGVCELKLSSLLDSYDVHKNVLLYNLIDLEGQTLILRLFSFSTTVFQLCL